MRFTTKPTVVATTFKLMMCLIAGAAINVAVAFGCSQWLNPVKSEPTFAQIALGGSTRRDAPISVFQFRHQGTFVLLVGGVLYGSTAEPWHREEIASHLPRWTLRSVEHVLQHPKTPQGEDNYACLQASGWPMKCLWCDLPITSPLLPNHVSMPVAGGIDTGSTWPFGMARIAKALPVTPIWPAFIVNTLIYAGFLYVMLALKSKIQRMMRMRRNLCPACGYPLHTLVSCPECGWNKESKELVSS